MPHDRRPGRRRDNITVRTEYTPEQAQIFEIARATERGPTRNRAALALSAMTSGKANRKSS